MENEIEEYTDTPPSHILYEGKTMIYLKNMISSNTLAISRNNFEMSNISFKTLQSLTDFTKTKVYGVLGIVSFQNIPCLIFGTEFDLITFYLDKAVYKMTNVKYITLVNSKNDIKQDINKEFDLFKKKILKTNLIFSNSIDLTIPYYQQAGRNLNDVNLFFYNYEMIKPILLNNNIKNKHDFYTCFIDGYMTCYNHSLSDQEMILYILYRKNNEINYYECEITINYSTDVFDYICGMKIGNEKLNESMIKDLGRKNGILFDCSNNNDSKKYFKQILPYFKYIEYNRRDYNEKNIEKFIEENYKEIKKTQYYFTCKDPLTGKTNSKYKQQESTQNGSCIIIFNDIKPMILFNKYLNTILFTNYMSQYQKEKDFKKLNNDFIQVNKINKIDYFYSQLKNIPDEFHKILKEKIHFNFKNFIYKNKKEKSKKSNLENIKLFIGTFNVSAIEPNTILSKFDVTSFLFPKKFSKNISKKNLPDIIYIAFEEIVELNANNILISSNQDIVDLYTTKITTEICKHYPYILKIQESMVGVLSLLFIKSELDDLIDNLNVIENKTGNLGLGNKGNFIIQFKLNNKEFALINGHLSAGEKKENFDKRVDEIREIFDNIYENKNKENIVYFISGDLNFRIELPKERFNEICSGNADGPVDESQAKNKIDILKKYDQMNEVKKIFKNEKLYEEKISFPPTYKYNKDNNTYNEKRTPSWTDRILYKKDNSIKCIFYDTIDLYISDHKPLVGLFEIGLN